MNRKKDTPGRIIRRRYEQRHKDERKANYKVWGTSVSRVVAEEIDAFLAERHISKVALIMEGYASLKAKAEAAAKEGSTEEK